jgi:hypothetical protein
MSHFSFYSLPVRPQDVSHIPNDGSRYVKRSSRRFFQWISVDGCEILLQWVEEPPLIISYNPIMILVFHRNSKLATLPADQDFTPIPTKV